MNVSQILQAAAQLSTTDQLTLNKALVDLIRRNRKVQLAQAGAKFVPGQIVRFDAKRKGIKHIKIEKFNRAGTAVVGYECDKDGVQFTPSTRWTVATTLCTPV